MRCASLAIAAVLACASPTLLSAADAPAATATAAPAVNVAFGKKALKVVDPAVTTAQAGLEAAKAGSSFGFGGDKVKKKIEKAQGDVDTGKALQSDLKLIADGKAPAKDGVIASLTASNPNKPGMMDKLKALPGVEPVTNILLTPGVPEALLSMAPIDKVPGAQAVTAFLK